MQNVILLRNFFYKKKGAKCFYSIKVFGGETYSILSTNDLTEQLDITKFTNNYEKYLSIAEDVCKEILIKNDFIFDGIEIF